MEYYFEKKGHRTIRVSSSGEFPEIMSYDYFFDYIKKLLVAKSTLQELSYQKGALTISKVYYDDDISYVNTDTLIFNAQLINDSAFLNHLFEQLNYYERVKKTIHTNIQKERATCAEKRTNNIKKYQAIGDLNDAYALYTETGVLKVVDSQETLTILDSLKNERTISQILFPTTESIYLKNKNGKAHRYSFYISLSAFFISLIGTVAIPTNLDTSVIINGITASLTVITGAKTVIYDTEKLENFLSALKNNSPKSESKDKTKKLKPHH